MTGLTIDALTVRIPLRGGAVVHAATEVCLDLAAGTVTALVGESGCGKSIVASTVLGVLPREAVTTGSVRLSLGDRTIDVLADAERYRGRHIALVPQSPSTHFTPVRTIGSQLAETIDALGTTHTPGDLVARAGLSASALGLYPHELSGGMAQRAAVAAALAGDPEVIVADEPTSGLDRDRTDQVGKLLRTCADAGAAVLLITHDLGHLLRADLADTVAIMYASRLMEVGPGTEVLADPWHDYTRDLLSALPQRGLRPLPHPPRALTDLSEICPYAGGPTTLIRKGQRMIRVRT
ncbi:ATP-binding cassette domain-containing protein [Nocardia mangyaensis]|uniref:ATP-binding cassette domain-containing protein n=1 Tax=Nocardia mangyaensis TaxID=2213200 RepID=UPI0026774329|nr:ATP-binding cassette domain-containing protein [Nocardia mangyaensis]MDO3645495.1 ATP-binding cassette domain-containing protein [Nocardia mangyaensis]